MATALIRFTSNSSKQTQPAWGVLFDGHIAPLEGTYETTSDVLRHGLQKAKALTAADATIPSSSIHILSPITTNQQFVCQGINYVDHIRESGLDPAHIPFNTIFTKASSCLSGPYDDVVCPSHVKLLDYEIELGLVVGRDLRQGEKVSADRLHEVLAGVTIVNDVSARDVQLPQSQFYKGKSYRTFGPTGPCILLLEPQEWQRLPQLHMKLSVNGQVRQDAYCSEMLFKPHQTLTELSNLQDLLIGDLIATGTPNGCAAKAPNKAAMFVAKHFVSEATKWKLFIQSGLKNPLYLKPNDLMSLSIRTDDGMLDLGTQKTRVV